jgi:hypothetical protein
MIRKIHTGGLAGCLARLLPLAWVVITGMQTAEAKECSVALHRVRRGIGRIGSLMDGNAGIKAKTIFRNHYCSGLSMPQLSRLSARLNRTPTRLYWRLEPKRLPGRLTISLIRIPRVLRRGGAVWKRCVERCQVFQMREARRTNGALDPGRPIKGCAARPPIFPHFAKGYFRPGRQQ